MGLFMSRVCYFSILGLFSAVQSGGLACENFEQDLGDTGEIGISECDFLRLKK